jgi:glycine cleavage system regulatory protein
MTPRLRAMRQATAVVMRVSGPAQMFDPLVDALERAELLELELVNAAQRHSEERAHAHALIQAAKALRRKGVNPVTWSALVRALAAHSGQKELPHADAVS